MPGKQSAECARILNKSQWNYGTLINISSKTQDKEARNFLEFFLADTLKSKF